MTERLPKLHDPEFLIFIRHGQTDWNAEGRMQGQKDIPLNAIGIAQAKENGKRLGAFFEREGLSSADFDFVASPLGRTRQTMDLVRQNMGLPLEGYRLEPLLKELTFGSWEGLTLEELAVSQPERVEIRRNDKWGFVPPDGGESYAMLFDRIGSWLPSVTGPSVVVAHGGVFRVLRAMLEGLEPQAAAKLDVPQDKVFVWRNGSMEWA